MKRIDIALLDSLTLKAKDSPRKRANFNLHGALNDPVQRLCNAIEPETYIRPHRHAEPESMEVFLLLRGSAVLLLFEESGKVAERALLSARGPLMAVEIAPCTWHSIASLESGTVFFEVKKGPYVPVPELHFASWAPRERDPGAARFVAWYKNAGPGDNPPTLSTL